MHKHTNTPVIQRKSRRCKSSVKPFIANNLLEKAELRLEVKNILNTQNKNIVKIAKFDLKSEISYPQYVGYFFRDYYKVKLCKLIL
jgi:hypothetical protein